MARENGPVVLTTFTDPMMGLAYECEPVFRRLETHFPGMVRLRHAMVVLVRDVYELVDAEDLREGNEAAIRRYDARLAKIYEAEEAISGMPIDMRGFQLFTEEHPSSLPLCLAYEAARLAAPGRADAFLYALRWATVVGRRQITRQEEILTVVRACGIDEAAFLSHQEDGSARAALDRDEDLARRLGIRTLPAFLIQDRDRGVLIRGLAGYDAFVSAIAQVTDGAVRPVRVVPSMETLRGLLAAHPLISPIEIREALDLHDTEEVRELLRPLIEEGEITIETVHHGWYLRRTSR